MLLLLIFRVRIPSAPSYFDLVPGFGFNYIAFTDLKLGITSQCVIRKINFISSLGMSFSYSKGENWDIDKIKRNNCYILAMGILFLKQKFILKRGK